MALVPFTYFNIYNNENNKNLNFYVNDKQIHINEIKEKGIGGQLWDCVIIISFYINYLIFNIFIVDIIY